MIEFDAWPKTPRLFRDVVITEKIDGTNAAVIITEDGEVAAQSRKRLITPEDDNFGFARWVHENHDALQDVLGVGRHFGEWWGSGIQRGYGLTEKRFSLFNTGKWATVAIHDQCPPGLGVVPQLYTGEFNTEIVLVWLDELREKGSHAAPGFMRPEGICAYHTASRSVYKATLDGDGAKGNG